MKRLTLFLTLTALAGTVPAAAEAADEFAGPIEEAHGLDTWSSKGAFETHITVEFGGQRLIDGTLLMDPSGAHVRLELVDGTVLVFDGRDAWVSPSDSAFQGARFHVLTWPYFVAAPMKLRDPGTRLEDLGPRPFRDGRELPAARLTFASGVGDTPDDWYVVYRDSANRLAAMGYVVTFGKSLEDAEKEPHAITYADFQAVDGVAVSHHWQFWNWSAGGGVTGDPIGEVKLSGARFVDPAADAFRKPADAKRADLP